MNLVVVPANLLPAAPISGAQSIALYEDPRRLGVGTAGTGLLTQIRRAGLSPSARAWDFLSVALAVVAADQACLRSGSADGWTRQLDVTVAVNDPDFWTDCASSIESLLGFLTGDIWSLSFAGDGLFPAPPTNQATLPEIAVTLLSGGLDSLIGSIDRTIEGVSLFAVSQVSDGDKVNQAAFAAAIGEGLRHLQLNHNARPLPPMERSQRSRSFVFIAFAVLAASSLDAYEDGDVIDVFIPENGFISLNIPLTDLRIGSLSTRTTHPRYIRELQSLLDACGFRVRLRNPYQFCTKGEMLAGCQDQALLLRLASHTTSCGRFARHGYKHCGRCVPCLVRRAAFLHWGRADETAYVYHDLSIADVQHKEFQDVRSACMAVEYVRLRGIESWVGGSLSRAQLGDIEPFVDVARRGLDELAGFLTAAGAL